MLDDLRYIPHVNGTARGAWPTLFLDYDGPLHPDEVYLIKGKIVLKADGVALFEYAPLLEQALAPFPQVKLVLATSWVKALGFDQAKAYLPAGLQTRVTGATYHSKMPREWWSSMTRYEQIAAYVREHGVQRWLALDNDDEGWPETLRNRLVHVDDWLGVFEARAQQELQTKLEALVAPLRP